MKHTAEILSVGTELLLGGIANTDAQDVSRLLAELGINVYYHTVVGDNAQRLAAAVETAKSRADVIITTGGLGPTYDDITRKVVCESFGLELVYHEEAARQMREYMQSRLHAGSITPNNDRQIMLPRGCTVLENTCGTAPGCAFYADGVHVVMLPGPPSECRAMLQGAARQYLLTLCDSGIWSHDINIFGMGESAVEHRLRELMESLENPTLAPYAGEGQVTLRVTAKAETREEAEEMMQPVIRQVQAELGSVIYGVDAGSLQAEVSRLLLQAGRTMAAAESCTGGMISARMTDLPGASRVFLGGAVTYATDAKAKILSVERTVLEKEGAVSAETARQMAENVRRITGADYGLSVTGLAGPEGDGSGLEVGTVFVAVSDGSTTRVRRLQLGGNRARIRNLAANHALDTLRRMLLGIPVQ